MIVTWIQNALLAIIIWAMVSGVLYIETGIFGIFLHWQSVLYFATAVACFYVKVYIEKKAHG